MTEVLEVIEDDSAIKESKELSKQIKALDAAFAKKFGSNYKGFTEVKEDANVQFISTGCYSIDYVCGGGGPNYGIPIGKVIEISGNESCGKTLIASHIAGEFQRQGKLVAFIDCEMSMDRAFAGMCGFNLDESAFIRPSGAEQALEALREFVRSGIINLIILDSVCSINPQPMQDKGVGEATMAVAARYWSTLLPELVMNAAQSNCTIILLNQLRTQLGSYGAPLDSGGGKAIKYYSSVRLRTSKTGILKKGAEEVGITVGIKSIKNKVAIPFKDKEISVYFPHLNEEGKMTAGIDIVSDVIEAGLDKEVIKKAGSWYEYESIRTQGKDAMKVELSKQKDVFKKLQQDIKI